MDMNETRAGLEYERIITKSLLLRLGIFGIFAGLVDLKLMRKRPFQIQQSVFHV